MKKNIRYCNLNFGKIKSNLLGTRIRVLQLKWKRRQQKKKLCMILNYRKLLYCCNKKVVAEGKRKWKNQQDRQTDLCSGWVLLSFVIQICSKWLSKRQNSAVALSCALVHLSSCPLKVILMGWSSGMVSGFLPQRWIPAEGKVRGKKQGSFNENRIRYTNK